MLGDIGTRFVIIQRFIAIEFGCGLLVLVEVFAISEALVFVEILITVEDFVVHILDPFVENIFVVVLLGHVERRTGAANRARDPGQ